MCVILKNLIFQKFVNFITKNKMKNGAQKTTETQEWIKVTRHHEIFYPSGTKSMQDDVPSSSYIIFINAIKGLELPLLVRTLN